MADIVTFNCLIQGDIPSEHVFTVDIDKNKTVAQLKAKIKDTTPRSFGNVDVRDITLWKVNISLEPTSNSDYTTSKLTFLEKEMDLDIAQEFGGRKLQSTEKILNVFAEKVSDKYIHIVAGRPPDNVHDLRMASQDKKLDQLLEMTGAIMDSLENLHTKVNGLQRIVFQLHEDTVPRLFIILPEDGAWDFTADALFARSYRLYFLCEHRQVLPNGEEVSQVHLANHEGYRVRQPRQFMEKYGSYILQIMPYFRIAIHLAQTSLELMPFVGEKASRLLEAGGNVSDAVLSVTDFPILKGKEYMHLMALEMCAGAEHLLAANNYQTSGRFGSVGRPDLRALQTYLHGMDAQNSLGRLQRVLSKSDVLWVCEAHATTCYANDNIKEIQRIISGSSMKGKVFFDNEAYELRIEGLDRTSLISLSRQLKPHLQHVALLKISFKNVKKTLTLDPGFQALLDVTSTVRTLWFKDCGFQSSMLKSRIFHYLQELRFDDTNIGPNGARSLASSLQQTKSLAKLYLNRNDIRENGAIALAGSFKQNSTLTQISLVGNDIGDKGVMALAESLKQNSILTQLDLRGNNIEAKSVIALADSIKQNSTLNQLDLSDNAIGDDGVIYLAKSLKQNFTLTQLDLRSNGIGEKGATSLADSLKQNSAIIRLDLSENDIGEKGAMALANTLKQNITLTQLYLNTNNIGDSVAVTLANSLEQNSTLTLLHLRINRIGGKGALALADSLKLNSTLTQLDLTFNSIGENGAIALADSLKQNPTLTHLSLGSMSRNLVKLDNGIGDNGAMALADSLKRNSTLVQLDLSYNGIGINGLISLADSLKHNSALDLLDLSANGIRDDGAMVLADSLKQKLRLTQLDLSDNFIGKKGAIALVDSIKRNSTFTRLDLSENGIGEM